MPVSLFIATKWEAFKNRGSDPRISHDFEDIIYVLDNNLNLVEDVKKSDKDVKLFLKEMSEFILTHTSRNEIVECHINPFTKGERGKIIIDKLQAILELE